MIRKTGVWVLLSFVFVLFTCSSSVAEPYLGGGLGVSMPHDVTDWKGSSGSYNLTLTDFTPENSFAGGIKTGLFFKSMPNFGVEFNLSISDPDVDKEAITAAITGTAAGVFSGQASGDFLGTAEVDSLISYGFLAMLRVTDEDAKAKYNGIQPFLGLGFTVSTIDVNSATLFNTAGTQLSTTANSDSSTGVGFLLSAGLNYIVSDNIKVFSEYGFGTVEHTLTMDTGVNSEMTSESSSVVFGVSYSF